MSKRLSAGMVTLFFAAFGFLLCCCQAEEPLENGDETTSQDTTEALDLLDSTPPGDTVGPEVDDTAVPEVDDPTGEETTSGPLDIPARQIVTFEIVNQAEGDRFVVSGGHLCATFSIERKVSDGYAIVPLEIGYQSICESAHPGDPYVTDFRRLVPDGVFAFTWDARELVMAVEDVDCTEYGWPNVTAQMITAVRQPVEPGDYRVTIAVEHDLPGNCVPVTIEMSTTCRDPEVMPPSGPPPTPPEDRCLSSTPIEVDFTLPEQGNPTVQIPVE